jgi:hypothetical protein
MFEGIPANPPQHQPRGIAKLVAGIDYLVPLLDIGYVLFWIPATHHLEPRDIRYYAIRSSNNLSRAFELLRLGLGVSLRNSEAACPPPAAPTTAPRLRRLRP